MAQPIETWKEGLANSFESNAFKKHTELEAVKSQLYSEGAVYASMTGSGSTLFGIYTEKPGLTFPTCYERVLKL